MNTLGKMELEKKMIEDIKSIESFADIISKNYDKRNGKVSFNSRLYDIENLISNIIKSNEKLNYNPLDKNYATSMDVSRIEETLEGAILQLLVVYKAFSDKNTEDILHSMRNQARIYAGVSEMNETQMEKFWNIVYPSEPYAEIKKKFTKVK